MAGTLLPLTSRSDLVTVTSTKWLVCRSSLIAIRHTNDFAYVTVPRSDRDVPARISSTKGTLLPAMKTFEQYCGR